jgi:hypothetical protein
VTSDARLLPSAPADRQVSSTCYWFGVLCSSPGFGACASA